MGYPGVTHTLKKISYNFAEIPLLIPRGRFRDIQRLAETVLRGVQTNFRFCAYRRFLGRSTSWGPEREPLQTGGSKDRIATLIVEILPGLPGLMLRRSTCFSSRNLLTRNGHHFGSVCVEKTRAERIGCLAQRSAGTTWECILAAENRPPRRI